MDSNAILALVIFITTYVFLMMFPKYRPYIALGSAITFIILGLTKVLEIDVKNVFGGIDWNVLMMIAGTMGIVALFIESKMPALLADKMIEKMPNVKWAIIALALFSGLVSAFIDNVATVLIVAPIALDIARKLKISPVNAIIAIAISSNLQGAATLVGDTTSIMLAGTAEMNFMDFFVFQGKLGLFFIVQLGMIASTFVLLWVFRKDNEPVDMKSSTEVKDYFPTILLVGMIVLLIIASFINFEPKVLDDHKNGIICVSLLIIGLVRTLIKKKTFNAIIDVVKEIDTYTLLLLFGLFMVVASISEAGVIDAIGKFIGDISQGNVFVAYTIIVWVSVLLSAFIDNIPYVLTMLPVCTALGTTFGIEGLPYVLYFGLLVGATLGGNLTPIGASANITGIGILRKEGHEVSNLHFMKISIPFTLAAVTTGYILVWLLFGL